MTFYFDYGAPRKEPLDTLADFINRYDIFKGNLGYNLKVLFPEAIIKLAQVTLKCNKLEAEFYLNCIIAGTDCNKIFPKRLVSNSNDSLYAFPKWEKLLVIETGSSYFFCNIFIFCQCKLSEIGYETCCNKENICQL